MKKLVIALMAVLLLTGCAAQPVQTEPTLPPAETTIPTEPLPSIYVENSPMERGTGGAVADRYCQIFAAIKEGTEPQPLTLKP